MNTTTGIKRPSDRALIAWYKAQPEGDYICTTCGKVGPKAYVQPQHPFYAEGREGTARCTDCYNRAVERARAARKAALAAEPRCEVPGCKRRGNFEAAGTRICGRHLKHARAVIAARMNASGLAYLGMFGGGAPITREALLNAAQAPTTGFEKMMRDFARSNRVED